MVEFLLTNGGTSLVNVTDEEGWAPIHSASSAGHLQVVRSLVQAGADVHQKNSSGCTALHYAASKVSMNIFS